jgi:hypothetical protein
MMNQHRGEKNMMPKYDFGRKKFKKPCVSVKKIYEEIKKILRTLVTWRKKKHLVNARSFHYDLSRMKDCLRTRCSVCKVHERLVTLGNVCHGNDVTNMGTGQNFNFYWSNNGNIIKVFFSQTYLFS